MLDTTSLNPTMTAAWRENVSYGDIVSFRFPLAEDGDNGQPKARPCLILDIEVIGGQRYALLAYGTTSLRRSNVGQEIHIRRRADYILAGLDEPTRFVAARRLLVLLTHRGFMTCGMTQSAVLGRLTGEAFERMNAVRGCIHALRDIREDRRGTSRRRGKQRTARPVIVEQRRPPSRLPGHRGDTA